MGTVDSGEGHRIFVDELTRFAQEAADQRLLAIAQRTGVPLRVAVSGRPGVGRRTVTRALDRAGLSVTTGTPAAELHVHVVAEVVKPEDTGAGATLAVLNKADLTTFASRAEPVAAARVRCEQFSELLGAPVLPMSGLLAAAALEGLDPVCWAALRALAADPDGLDCLDRGFDGFLAARLTVPVAARWRLLAVLDLFGIALAVAALRRGAGPAGVRAVLRRVSGVEAVLERLVVAGARPRYRRVLDAVADLEALAVSDARVAAFLARDATVVARMAAALDAARADELELGPVTPLQRAAHWQRRQRAATNELHRACAADIARGSLRLWARRTG
ncbi:hypothetical protein [Mycobacterium asiaticum]|uniref:Uncharacterized protein n=1 Tax=Mycobacterium asiaticum TaxID=1790 RepID=A0A1A3BS47_MYCAS|nr:hypothetical protein [Mycobacterium asiaticum]OBI77739.1 hypothetical protein A9X01_02645 [Mycobacterium asiaticum]